MRRFLEFLFARVVISFSPTVDMTSLEPFVLKGLRENEALVLFLDSCRSSSIAPSTVKTSDLYCIHYVILYPKSFKITYVALESFLVLGTKNLEGLFSKSWLELR